VKIPYSEANGWSTSQQIPPFYGSRMFIIAITTANHRISSAPN